MSWLMLVFRSAKSEHSASILVLIVPSGLAETATRSSLRTLIASAISTSMSAFSSGVKKADALITVSVDTLNRINVALRKACTTESLMGRLVPLRKSSAMFPTIVPDWRLRRRPALLVLLEPTPRLN